MSVMVIDPVKLIRVIHYIVVSSHKLYFNAGQVVNGA